MSHSEVSIFAIIGSDCFSIPNHHSKNQLHLSYKDEEDVCYVQHVRDVILIAIAVLDIKILRSLRATERSVVFHPTGSSLQRPLAARPLLLCSTNNTVDAWAVGQLSYPYTSPHSKGIGPNILGSRGEQTDASQGTQARPKGQKYRPPFLNGGQLKTRKQEGKAYISGPCKTFKISGNAWKLNFPT